MRKIPMRRVIGRAEFNFLKFENLKEFDDFVAEELADGLSPNNQGMLDQIKESSIERLASGWFGEGKVKDLEELEKHTVFQKPELFQEVEKEIRNSLEVFEKLESTTPVKIKKIAYNSMGFGVFSFDRAAMGLTRIKTQNGKEKITTTVKDVYAWFLNKPIEQRGLKIYIVAGGAAGVQGKQMLYTGMSACVLADYLTL
ncbi:MAG TPA: hypothetical protein VF691_16810, partial [Cytophagaceae bacterium]